MQPVNNCFQCGLCTGFCPKRRVSKYSPRIKINEFLQNNARAASWECLTCGLCSLHCPQNVDYLGFVREQRMGKAESEIAHKSVFTLLCEIMNRASGAKGVPVDFTGKTDQNSEIAYFPGCIDFFDCFLDVGVSFHDIGESSIKLLNKIGVTPRVLSLRCCGHDSLWQGQTEIFDELKRHNTDIVRKSGIKTLVTSCAECFRTFSKDYDLGIEVVHISQMLEKNLHRLNLAANGYKVTYHDPCRLGRHMGVYEAPRSVLHAVKGLVIKELDGAKEDSQCCGVSAWASCNTEAKVLMVEKLDDAANTGASVLVTTCPKCYAHLNCVRNEKPPIKSFNISVVDFAVFLAQLDGPEGKHIETAAPRIKEAT